MVKRKENPWQFKFSFALAIIMLFLVFGYFTQSFLEIRKVKPVTVAIERLTESRANPVQDEPAAKENEQEGAVHESTTP
jgi:hypothetical protein